MRFQTRDEQEEDETCEASVMIKRKQALMSVSSEDHATKGAQMH